MKFVVGTTWVSRDGSKWRILATDGLDRVWPIIAMDMGDGSAAQFDLDGKFIDAEDDDESNYDLIREDREPREWKLAYSCGAIGLVDGPTIVPGETVRVREIE